MDRDVILSFEVTREGHANTNSWNDFVDLRTLGSSSL